jgi:hypothetical protein
LLLLRTKIIDNDINQHTFSQTSLVMKGGSITTMSN